MCTWCYLVKSLLAWIRVKEKTGQCGIRYFGISSTANWVIKKKQKLIDSALFGLGSSTLPDTGLLLLHNYRQTEDYFYKKWA